MLAIRLKRVGRSNLAQYRVIVQDSHRHPKRGAVTEYLGTYDPHAKTLKVDKDRIKHYLDNGAQPSNAIAKLFKANKIKLPKWVDIAKNPKRKTKNPEKLRKNQPKQDKPSESAKVEEASVEEPKKEAPADETNPEEPKEKPKAEDSKPESKPDESKDGEPAAAAKDSPQDKKD